MVYGMIGRRLLFCLFVAGALAGCSNAQSPSPAPRDDRANTTAHDHGANPNEVQAWLSAVKDPDSAVRRRAASAPPHVARNRKEIVSALAEATQDSRVPVRHAAVVSLGKMGPAARDAIPALCAALGDLTLVVRARAAEALQAIGPDSSEVVDALLQCMVDASDETGVGAAQLRAKCIIALGCADLSKLTIASHAPEGPVRRELCSVLAYKGPDALPTLSELLRDETPEVRASAAAALRTLGAKAAPALPLLIQALKDPDERVRVAAINAIGAVGPAGAIAVEPLTSIAKDRAAAHRWEAIRALRDIGPAAKDAVPALREVFTDVDESALLRVYAAEAHWKIARDAREVLPLLVAVLGETNNTEGDPGSQGAGGQLLRIRRRAIQLIGEMGPEAGAAKAALMRARNDPHGLVRLAAIDALEKIDSQPAASQKAASKTAVEPR